MDRFKPLASISAGLSILAAGCNGGLENPDGAKTHEDQSALTCSSGCGVGLNAVDGIWAYSNSPYQGTATSCGGTGTYGYLYQCVEYAQRYMAQKWGTPAMWPVSSAYQMCDLAASFYTNNNLTKHSYGDGYTPKHGDLLVLHPNIIINGSSITGGNGHVAVINTVSGNMANCVEENGGWSADGCNGTHSYNWTDTSWVRCTIHSNANGSSYNASWYNQSYPTSMNEGTSAPVYVQYTNTGTATWDTTWTRLGTQVPQDRNSQFCGAGWISCNRPAHVSAPTPPGQIGTFSFTMYAPYVCSSTYFQENWGLVQDGVTWFGPGAGGVWFGINVLDRNGGGPC